MASTETDNASTRLPHPIFITENAIVRPYAFSDAESLSKAANNPNVVRYMRDIFPSPYTLADAEFWISLCTKDDPASPKSFVIIYPTTGAVMGSIGLTPEKDVHCRSSECGYWLAQEYWAKGVMGQVVPAFLDWAFTKFKVADKDGDKLPLTRIWASVVEGNEGSVKVLKKAGMLYEGRLRASVWKFGKVLDQTLHSMTYDDWEKRRKDVTT